MGTGARIGPASSRVEQGWRNYRQRLVDLAESSALAPLRGRTIVVLGSTGTLGSAVMRVLGTIAERIDPRTEIIGVTRHAIDRPVVSSRSVVGTTTNSETYAQLPNPDFVLYIAGPTSDYLSRPWETIDVTLNGLHQALDYARGCCGFVFVSSTRVFGPYCDGVIDEESRAVIDPMSPMNVYDASKRLAESLLLVEHNQHSFPGTVVRLANIYGPYASNPRNSFLGRLLRSMCDHGHVELTGHPETTRNYCFVADAAEGLLLALAGGSRGRAYLIGSEEHRTNAEFVRDTAELIGREITVDASTAASDSPRSVTRISVERARRELGYRPQGKISECLPFVVDWTLQAIEGISG